MISNVSCHESDDVMNSYFMFSSYLEFLKTCFKRFNENNNVVDFMKMVIVARQIFYYAKDPEMTYKTWVKQTIGEMNYQLKCQIKFTQALEALQSLIFFETDLKIIEIHVQTPIASPRGSNSLVLEYKQQLKTRIASLKDPDSFMDLT
jgi:Fanconi anaemia group A protein N terminus